MIRKRRNNTRQYQPRRRRRGGALRSILLTLLMFSILIAIILSLPDNRRPAESLTGSVYVIDGDTVILNKGHIRLIGIDAPEMKQSCQIAGRDYLCGRDARNALRSRINGQSIRCEISGTDKYGRELGRCYQGETDLNKWMVEQGWAISYGDYRSEEAQARHDRRGIWAGSFEVPYEWRKEHQQASADTETSHNTQSSDVIGTMIHYIKDQITKLLNAI